MTIFAFAYILCHSMVSNAVRKYHLGGADKKLDLTLYDSKHRSTCGVKKSNAVWSTGSTSAISLRHLLRHRDLQEVLQRNSAWWLVPITDKPEAKTEVKPSVLAMHPIRELPSITQSPNRRDFWRIWSSPGLKIVQMLFFLLYFTGLILRST